MYKIIDRKNASQMSLSFDIVLDVVDNEPLNGAVVDLFVALGGDIDDKTASESSLGLGQAAD